MDGDSQILSTKQRLSRLQAEVSSVGKTVDTAFASKIRNINNELSRASRNLDNLRNLKEGDLKYNSAKSEAISTIERMEQRWKDTQRGLEKWKKQSRYKL